MRTARLIPLSVALLVLAASANLGCEHIQKPSHDECNAAAKRLISLTVEKEVGEEHEILGGIAGKAMTLFGDVTGQTDKLSAECMKKWNKATVNCILSSRNSADLERCK